jgi:hypothetical protein
MLMGKSKNRDDWYIILPGIGVKECSLGMNKRNFRREFGAKRLGHDSSIEDVKTETAYYLRAKNKGVDALIERGKMRTLFFYFISKTHKSFSGETDKGIGRDSSIEDVVTNYGEPDDVHESVASNYAAIPGAHKKWLHYDSLNISFTFLNGRLADIRTTTSEKALPSKEKDYNETIVVSKTTFLSPSDELEAVLTETLKKAPVLNKEKIKVIESNIPSSQATFKEGSLKKVTQEVISCLKKDYVDLAANRYVRSVDRIELWGVTDLHIRLLYTNDRGLPVCLPHIIYRKNKKRYKLAHHGKS